MRHWIDSNEAFAQFCRELPKALPVSLDTEFQWRSTYFPVFALLQIGLNRDGCAIVDALAVTDWTPLAELLNDGSRRKIFFSSGNDLPILVRACGGYETCVPRNIFDVQVSNGFIGGVPNSSLKNVIAQELNIELPKNETCSDWTVRPLTPEQLKYAGDDVVLLPEIAVIHEEKMKAMETWNFFVEDMLQLGDEALYTLPDENDAWKNVGGYWKIHDENKKTLLRSLAVWREKTARKNNIPRNFIFKDEALFWLLEEKPQAMNGLMRMPFARHSVLRQFGQEILRQIQNPDDIPVKHVEQPSLKCTAFDQLCARIAGCAQKFAKVYGLSPQIVAVNRDVNALAARIVRHQNTDGLKLTTGWRKLCLKPLLEDGTLK